MMTDIEKEAVTMTNKLAGPENEVSVDLQGEAVVIQGGRYRALRLSSTEQLVDENYKGTNSNCLRKILNSRFVVGSVVVALIGVIIVLSVLLSLEQEHKEQSPCSDASRLRSDLNVDDGIDWRISANSSCKGPSCIACKEDIITSLESRDCSGIDVDVTVKNGSCVSCGENCWTLQDLVNKTKQNKTRLDCPNKRPLQLTNCCVLSYIGNRTNYCGEGQYLCYTETIHNHYTQMEHEPICTCPPGSQSNRCNKPYTQLGDCKCYKTSRKFSGQEQITKCDNVKTNWTTCRMEKSEPGVHYNCLCHKSTGNDAHSARCPQP